MLCPCNGSRTRRVLDVPDVDVRTLREVTMILNEQEEIRREQTEDG